MPRNYCKENPMDFIFFPGNKAKAKVAQQRLISSTRIHSRRGQISKWAAEAQKCDIAIAEIDKKLSKLKGIFIRAPKEHLEVRRLIWEGRRNQAVVKLNRQKTTLTTNVKHNQDLTAKRYSI